MPLIWKLLVDSGMLSGNGSGRRSGAFWEALRRISRPDIEFLRNGKPFFALWVSDAACDGATAGGGSEVRRVPAGLFPTAPTLCCRSVGATKEFVCLTSWIGATGGRVDGKLVLIGGGRGLVRVLP